jgi:hypothetical protein
MNPAVFVLGRHRPGAAGGGSGRAAGSGPDRGLRPACLPVLSPTTAGWNAGAALPRAVRVVTPFPSRYNQIMSTAYLETSFFSECCTIRTSEVACGRRATSLNCWNRDARKFDLYISNEVVRKLSSTVFPEQVRTPALSMLRRPVKRPGLEPEADSVRKPGRDRTGRAARPAPLRGCRRAHVACGEPACREHVERPNGGRPLRRRIAGGGRAVSRGSGRQRPGGTLPLHWLRQSQG